MMKLFEYCVFIHKFRDLAPISLSKERIIVVLIQQ